MVSQDIQDMVDNPTWFIKQTEVNWDFKRGYNQAVYQMRLKLSSMDQEPAAIRRYTEFMIEELAKIITDEPIVKFTRKKSTKPDLMRIKSGANIFSRIWQMIKAPITWIFFGYIKIK